MPRFYNPAQEAHEWKQAQELAEQERRKDEHFARMANPLLAITTRLESLETEMEALSGVPWSGVIPSAPPPRLRRGGPRTSGDRLHG